MIYESIIKVAVADPPERRRRDIEEGLRYAYAILLDEYDMPADDLVELLERISDDIERPE